MARLGDRRRADRVLVEKHDEKRPLGRQRQRQKDNIKMRLQEVGQGRHGLHCSGSAEGQVVGACECSNEPSGSIKCGELNHQLKTCLVLRKDYAP